jgi:hypothetical protein
VKHEKVLLLIFYSLQRHEALLKSNGILETEKNGRFVRSALAWQRTTLAGARAPPGLQHLAAGPASRLNTRHSFLSGPTGYRSV